MARPATGLHDIVESANVSIQEPFFRLNYPYTPNTHFRPTTIALISSPDTRYLRHIQAEVHSNSDVMELCSNHLHTHSRLQPLTTLACIQKVA